MRAWLTSISTVLVALCATPASAQETADASDAAASEASSSEADAPSPEAAADAASVTEPSTEAAPVPEGELRRLSPEQIRRHVHAPKERGDGV